eukprot:CAMPEP_0181250278 /NCGR_PEP_ID=MMETSP1096-20121128/46232_1 /TAXON_ID=156174 ORGANISM="Chrysochromulina ericina, Strain CCMP281" /NCGR_SAMPLE_ID=MMETSP1096 /ASSEMBLY_ACC=CAM_ASM_000453 /LENGTH=137 /DNA_ID=CAMNT_0023347731 /DNA_START=412 /DNA_END=822 /DNA_ORIENTATION=+
MPGPGRHERNVVTTFACMHTNGNGQLQTPQVVRSTSAGNESRSCGSFQAMSSVGLWARNATTASRIAAPVPGLPKSSMLANAVESLCRNASRIASISTPPKRQPPMSKIRIEVAAARLLASACATEAGATVAMAGDK